jgi:hypothetical protein
MPGTGPYECFVLLVSFQSSSTVTRIWREKMEERGKEKTLLV